MNIQRRSKKFFVISTLLTAIALSTVLTVYAAVSLGIFYGGDVTVTGVTPGTIEYATTLDGSGGWTSTLEPGSSWFTRLSVSTGYNGPVTVTWQLQSYSSGTWEDVGVPTITDIELSGSAVIIYATSDGTLDITNRNWGTDAISPATYRVTAEIESVSA